MRDYFVGGDVEWDPWDEVDVIVYAAVGGWRVVATCGGSSAVGAFVGEDADCVGDAVGAAACLRDDVEPVAVDGLIGADDYVVALAYAHCKPSCVVRDDGGEVHGYDCHVVAVEADLVGVAYRRVDESHLVAFAFLDCVVPILAAALSVDVGAVDQDVVGDWLTSDLTSGKTVHDLISRLVEPVINRHDPEVLVIVVACRTINDDRAPCTIAILAGVM